MVVSSACPFSFVFWHCSQNVCDDSRVFVCKSGLALLPDPVSIFMVVYCML